MNAGELTSPEMERFKKRAEFVRWWRQRRSTKQLGDVAFFESEWAKFIDGYLVILRDE